MGLGISRWDMTSCGAFRRTNSELQDPSTYKRLMVDRDDQDNASDIGSGNIISQGQKYNSSLSKKEVVSSSLPNKDVINEEKNNTHINDIYRQLDEETENKSNYNGPIFMKSPSFRDFMRPIQRRDDSVKNDGKKEGEMREANKTETPNYVCTEEACMRVENKNETPIVNKEAGPGKDKKMHKIFSQYYKPSTVTSGVKNLFNYPKHPKPSN